MFKHTLQPLTLARKFDITHWFPCDADGRAYGHVVTQISRMDKLPNFLSYGAPLARAWSSPIRSKVVKNSEWLLMNTKAIIEFDFLIRWRIIYIQEAVIHLGHNILQSSISTILHIIFSLIHFVNWHGKIKKVLAVLGRTQNKQCLIVHILVTFRGDVIWITDLCERFLVWNVIRHLGKNNSYPNKMWSKMITKF